MAEFRNDNGKQKSSLRLWLIAINLVFAGMLIGLGVLSIRNIKDLSFTFISYPDPAQKFCEQDSIKMKKRIKEIQTKIANLEKKIAALEPTEPYLIINTTANTFVLRTKNKIIREGLCSTGSYTLLEADDGSRWIFKTPKGMFRIQGKVADPVWIKPDWAFIEEGLPVPPKNHPDRYEYGTLGDYALSLGKGYYIHGTLYQRYLGLPVTHGCVRMGDEDLKVVYQTLSVGSRVFIY